MDCIATRRGTNGWSVATAAILGFAGICRAGEADVYLLGGQSNMVGSGKVAELPADVPREPAATFFWNGKTFEPLVVGRTRTARRAEEFGPEVAFAAALQGHGRPQYLVKYAAGGMPLHHGWDADRWLGDPPAPGRRNFHPGERPDDPNQGKPYRDMLARFRAGIDGVRRRGDAPRIRALLWMQGEADAKHGESAAVYAASLRRLRDRLAQDLGVESLPLVFGQVLPSDPPPARFTHAAEIRAVMAAADQGSGRAEAIPGARMVPTDGCGLLPDDVHYDTAGLLQLGRSFAEAIRTLEATDGG